MFGRWVLMAAMMGAAGGAGAAQAGAVRDVPAMVRLRPGRFVAGSGAAETDAAHYAAPLAAREQPVRTVTIAYALAIGRTEVTRGQFARFVAATGWTPDGPCSHLIDGPTNTWAAESGNGRAIA